jgi:hypothetical protein
LTALCYGEARLAREEQRLALLRVLSFSRAMLGMATGASVPKIFVGRGFNRDIQSPGHQGFRRLCVPTALVGKPLKFLLRIWTAGAALSIIGEWPSSRKSAFALSGDPTCHSQRRQMELVRRHELKFTMLALENGGHEEGTYRGLV